MPTEPTSKEQKKALKAEQKKILETVFDYKPNAEITDEDKVAIREMFDTPEKFALLRKILGVLTTEERGLTLPDPRSGISASDYEKLGREHEMHDRVDERIRGALVSLYLLTKNDIVAEKTAEFEEANEAENEEAENTKTFEEQAAVDKRVAGENL